MKRLVCILWGTALVLCGMSSCSGENKGYTIEGSIQGMNEGMIYLKKNVEKSYVDVDSAIIENGTFEFKGIADEPMLYGLTTVKESKRPQAFFMGNEKLQIQLDETNKKIEVSSSSLNDLYKNNVSLLRTKGFSIDSLITAYPTSPVTAYFLANNLAYQFDLEQLKELRAKFDSSLDETVYIKQLEGIIERLANVQVGSVAPDFTLPDVDGNPISLSSYRGKYVLVDFWAAWCPDCRKENPNIVAAWKKYKDSNFDVLGVSLDRTKDQWVAAIEKDQLTWTHVSDLKDWNSDVALLYAIRWVPTSFILDPNGVILAVGLEGEDLLKKLEEILN